MAVMAVATITMIIVLLPHALFCATVTLYPGLCWRLNQGSILDLLNKIQGGKRDVVKCGDDECCNFCKHDAVALCVVDDLTIGP